MKKKSKSLIKKSTKKKIIKKKPIINKQKNKTLKKTTRSIRKPANKKVTKRPLNKNPSKKSPTKPVKSKASKTSSNKVKRKQLTSEQCFYLSNGAVIKSITGLRNALKDMDDATFYMHVNEYKSDFAAWIYHVFKNKTLSVKVGNIKNKEELIKIL